MVLRAGKSKHLSLLVLSMGLLVSITLLTISQVATAEESAKKSYDTAIEIVEQLHANLLEVMQAADTINFAERYSRLEPTIVGSFDTPVIAKVILSRYWKDLTKQQQVYFIELFNRLTVATYASRFNSFDDEIFRTKTVEQLKKGRILVRSEIQSSKEDPVNLDYLMHKNNDSWYIISVIADGVNDLSLKRAEYSTIIKKSGYESLLMNIEKKITEIENKKDK
jgi:phospholipid transport system substrate-binding protein